MKAFRRRKRTPGLPSGMSTTATSGSRLFHASAANPLGGGFGRHCGRSGASQPAPADSCVDRCSPIVSLSIRFVQQQSLRRAQRAGIIG